MRPAALLLADGSRYEGEGAGANGVALGEAVFFTGMTGYEEALTDPSYAGQILTFTYPLIGNYGISRSVAQHPRACASGAVMKHLARRPSHHAMKTDLETWLEEEGVPAIVGLDTRALVIALREHGTMHAALAVGDEAIAQADLALAKHVRETTTAALVPSVATPQTHDRPGGRGSKPKRIVVVDCGVKVSILENFEALGAHVIVVPYKATKQEILAHEPDAVVISPGPGDPTDLEGTIETLRELIGELPLFGVCLGHQLLALACGARTYKLPYGHRGGNHPVMDLARRSVMVTAHNHGYAVDGATLPDNLEATMVNLNDGTNEGFKHRTLPIAAVQFHPEASPGPSDARSLFARWLDEVR